MGRRDCLPWLRPLRAPLPCPLLCPLVRPWLDPLVCPLPLLRSDCCCCRWAGATSMRMGPPAEVEAEAKEEGPAACAAYATCAGIYDDEAADEPVPRRGEADESGAEARLQQQ